MGRRVLRKGRIRTLDKKYPNGNALEGVPVGMFQSTFDKGEDILSVGEKIKFYRELKGLTQRELAEMCDIPLGTIKSYESGGRNPKKEPLQKIAAALGVYPSAFQNMSTEDEMGMMLYLAHLFKIGEAELHGKKGADGKFEEESIVVSFRSERVKACLKRIADTQEVLQNLRNKVSEIQDEAGRKPLSERAEEIERELEWCIVQKEDKT